MTLDALPATLTTVRRIAAALGINVTSVHRRARREGWQPDRVLSLAGQAGAHWTAVYLVADLPREIRAALKPPRRTAPGTPASHGIKASPRRRREFLKLGT